MKKTVINGNLSIIGSLNNNVLYRHYISMSLANGNSAVLMFINYRSTPYTADDIVNWSLTTSIPCCIYRNAAKFTGEISTRGTTTYCRYIEEATSSTTSTTVSSVTDSVKALD